MWFSSGGQAGRWWGDGLNSAFRDGRESMGPDPTWPGQKDSETPATWLAPGRVEVFGPSSCPSKDPRGLLGGW